MFEDNIRVLELEPAITSMKRGMSRSAKATGLNNMIPSRSRRGALIRATRLSRYALTSLKERFHRQGGKRNGSFKHIRQPLEPGPGQ